MLKVILVDDEPIIREGLRTVINWESYGFQICGEAGNGMEGLAKIMDINPDLVIADIKMPVMDGLQMTEELRKSGFKCKVIILTAYSDFELARKSVGLGIDSYLLKPIEQTELVDKICKVKNEISDSYERARFIDQGLQLSKEKILGMLATGQICKQDDYNLLKLYNLDFPWKNYRIALVDIGKEHIQNIQLRNNAKSSIEYCISANNCGHVFEIGGYIGILFKSASPPSVHKTLINIQEKLEHNYCISAAISLGISVDNFEYIVQSYKHACRLMDKKFLYGHKNIMDNGEDDHVFNCKYLKSDQFDMECLLEDLYNAVDVCNATAINDILEEIKLWFIKLEYDEEIIKINYTNLYLTIVNKLGSLNNALRHHISNKKYLLEQIYIKKNLQDLHDFIKYNLLAISGELAANRPNSAIKRILDYIDRNYANDIKLETLASLFNYNCTYLGKLFKCHTNQCFNTYLDNVRIEKAKQMLREGMKVYQVAEKVGIKDIDYFYKKFKKYTGVCPSNYKEKSNI